MTIYWVDVTGDDLPSALAAVADALARGDTGTPPAAVPQPGDAPPPDGYREANLAVARATWSVDQQRIVVSSRPALGAAINAFQRLARRTTWWTTLPQWLQVSAWQGAATRVLDSLANGHEQSAQRLAALERELVRVHALDRQLYVLRLEQQELRRRISELEQQQRG